MGTVAVVGVFVVVVVVGVVQIDMKGQGVGDWLRSPS